MVEFVLQAIEFKIRMRLLEVSLGFFTGVLHSTACQQFQLVSRCLTCEVSTIFRTSVVVLGAFAAHSRAGAELSINLHARCRWTFAL